MLTTLWAYEGRHWFRIKLYAPRGPRGGKGTLLRHYSLRADTVAEACKRAQESYVRHITTKMRVEAEYE